MRKIFLILIILTFGFCTIAFSDTTIYLKGGGKVRGKVVAKSEKEIKIKTAIGFVIVERISVDKIETDELTDKLKPSKPEIELGTIDSLKEELKALRASISKEISQARAPLQKKICSLKKEREDLLVRQSELDEKLICSQNEIASLKKTLTETKNHLFDVEQELKEKTFSFEKLPPSANITQRKRPDFKDLLDLKLPEQTAELADKINSFYYNFIDKDVDAIRATISDSQMKDFIEKIENRYMAWDIDVAEKMEKIKIIATYKPFSDSLTFKICNKPKFKTEWLDQIVEETFIDSSIKIYKELLAEEMACLIPLINPKYNKVQSVKVINGDLIIKLLNQTETMHWTFDKEYRLKSIEKLDAEGKANIKQIYEFETYESKYLIKSFAEEMSDCYSRRKIEYQSVNGIKIPNKFFVSSIKGDSDKTSLELYLNDIEVVLNN